MLLVNKERRRPESLCFIAALGDAMTTLCKQGSLHYNSELVKMLTCVFSIINNITLH